MLANDAFGHLRSRSRLRERSFSPETPEKLTIEVDIPPRVVGLVIGRRGATLSSIQDSAGVYATVHQPGQGDERCYVLVRGEPQQVHLRAYFWGPNVLGR